MPTELSKLTATEQIEVMKSLSQQAAGWLVGVTSRSLRDHPELPRNTDGTYNAKELAAAPIASGTLPEESADEVEKMLQIGEWLGMASTCDSDGSLLTVIAMMESLRERHGNAGLALFASILMECFRDITSGWQREPTETELREKLDNEFRDRLDREQQARLRRQFRVSFVCDRCCKVRHGRDWIKGRAPVGYIELETICPVCADKPRPKTIDAAFQEMANRAVSSVAS